MDWRLGGMNMEKCCPAGVNQFHDISWFTFTLRQSSFSSSSDHSDLIILSLLVSIHSLPLHQDSQASALLKI